MPNRDVVRLDRSRAALVAAGAAVLTCLVPLVTADHTSDLVAGVIVPTGRQEYFVLGHEQHVWNMLKRVYDVRAGNPRRPTA